MTGPRRGGRLDVGGDELAAAGFEAGESRVPVPREPHRVEKPWGYELIWAHTDHYVGKLLVVRAGEALSLQFHEEKDETLYLLEGSLKLEVGWGIDSLRERVLEEGESIRVSPGLLHRIEARTDCTVLEVSTPELDDVVRVRDRYGRAGSDGVAE